MERYKIVVDGVATHIRELDYTEKWDRGEKMHICPLCKKKITPGKTYLFINNYTLFPNTIIHNLCVVYTPEKDWEATIVKLKDDFERAKAERERNRCWFGDG